MMNSCMLIAKIIRCPKIETIYGIKDFYMLLETNRPYRLPDGTLKKDIFRVRLWKGLAAECNQMCHEGSIVALKGRMETVIIQCEDHDEYFCYIIAENLDYIEGDGKDSWIMF